MECTANERIKLILEENNVSIRSFCNGDSAMSRKVQRQLNEGSVLTSDVITLAIDRFPRYRPMWILNGTGPKTYSSNNVASVNPDGNMFDESNLEHVNSAYDFCNNCISGDSIVVPYAPKDVFYIKARGNPMVKKGDCSVSIPDGSYVALRKRQTDCIQWGEVYAIKTRDGLSIKKLMPIKEDDSMIMCVSYNNEEYPSYTIKKSDIMQYMIVVGVVNVKWR